MRGTINLPTGNGAANWSGSGADPETGFVYVPSKTAPGMMTLTPLPEGWRAGRPSRRSTARRLPYVPNGKIGPPSIHPANPPPPAGPQGLPLVKPPYSRMTAYDMNTGDIAWQVPTGRGPGSHPQAPGAEGRRPSAAWRPGSPGRTAHHENAAGLRADPTVPGSDTGAKLVAYDKQTGATLGEVALPASPLGTPMTYLANGKQYIALTLQGGQMISLALP